jgi:hypothetical protein
VVRALVDAGYFASNMAMPAWRPSASASASLPLPLLWLAGWPLAAGGLQMGLGGGRNGVPPA